MKRSSWITLAVLAGTVVVIGMALVRYAGSGPSFRAQDYGTFAECVAAIPAEWEAGSLERSGAEDACRYVHLPRSSPSP